MRTGTVALPDIEVTAWRTQAACRDVPVQVFYPEPTGRGAKYRAALAYCAVCPVTAECLREALQTEQVAARAHGVWGGTTPAQRQRLLAAR